MADESAGYYQSALMGRKAATAAAPLHKNIFVHRRNLRFQISMSSVTSVAEKVYSLQFTVYSLRLTAREGFMFDVQGFRFMVRPGRWRLRLVGDWKGIQPPAQVRGLIVMISPCLNSLTLV